MITVGIKDKAWLYITDGTVIYSVGEDILNPGERARITKVDMTMEELRAHCKQQGIKLRKQRGEIRNTLMSWFMMLYFGLLGSLLGGRTGIIIGMGIGFLLSMPSSDFDKRPLRERFDQIDRNYKWQSRLDAEYEMYKRQQEQANASLEAGEVEGSDNVDR